MTNNYLKITYKEMGEKALFEKKHGKNKEEVRVGSSHHNENHIKIHIHSDGKKKRKRASRKKTTKKNQEGYSQGTINYMPSAPLTTGMINKSPFDTTSSLKMFEDLEEERKKFLDFERKKYIEKFNNYNSQASSISEEVVHREIPRTVGAKADSYYSESGSVSGSDSDSGSDNSYASFPLENDPAINKKYYDLGKITAYQDDYNRQHPSDPPVSTGIQTFFENRDMGTQYHTNPRGYVSYERREFGNHYEHGDKVLHVRRAFS